MRVWRVAVGIVGTLAIAPLLSVAQQQPIQGCGAAISCRPRGFSALNANAGGGLLFGVAFAWDPGFKIFIVAPQNILLAPKPTPEPERGRLFHLGVSLLPPTPTPTPAPDGIRPR
jgi:hypothetical protein